VKQALVTSGLLSLAFIILILGGIAGKQAWNSPDLGFWRSLGSNMVYRIDPDGPAAVTDIRLGDVLTHVDGVPINEATPLFGDKHLGETLRFSLLRGPGDVRTVEVLLAPPSPREQVGRLLYLVLGLAFWSSGMAVFLRRRWDLTAQVFLMLSLWVAGALMVLPLTASQVDWARRVVNACVLLTATTFVHFHTLFPCRLAGPAWRALVAGLYAVTIPVAVIYATMGPLRLNGHAWSPYLQPGIRLYLVTAILSGLGLLLSAYASGSGAMRRRVRLIAGGSILALLVPVLLVFIPEALTGHTLVPYEMGVASLIFLLVAYAYSIYRDDLMAVDFALYRVLVYVIVAALLLVAYLALMTLAGHLLSPALASQPLAGAIASLLVATSFSPLQRGVQMTLQRLFFGPAYDYLDVLAQGGRHLAQSLDEDTLVELLTRHVPGAMGVTQAGLWVAEDGERLRWVGGRLSPAADQENQAGDPPVSPSPGRLVPPPSLMRRLRAGQMVQQSTATNVPSLNESVRWWVPLTLGAELQGLWAVGPRRGDESFSPVDRRLLRAAADQGALVVKVTRLLAALRQQLAQSEVHREELAQVYQRLVHSREEERKRLAMELHDEVIQSLAGFNLFLQEARSWVAGLGTDEADLGGGQAGAAHGANAVQGSALDGRLAELQAQVRQMIANTRRICQGLRPVTLDRLGLVAALHALARDVTERAGLEVHLELIPDDVQLGEDTEVTLYRLVQEGLHNVARHAQARNVFIRLQVTTDLIDLTIQDDGQGFEPPGRRDVQSHEQRLGLISMRERVAGLGGQLTIESAPGQGTLIHAHIPLADN